LPIESDEKAQLQEIAPLIAMGEEMLAEGDAERALSVFGQIAEMAPDNVEVVAGLARALVALGRLDEAEAALDALPTDVAKSVAIDQARAAIALARDVKPVADLSSVQAKVAADPDDHEARFELAGGLMANGDRDGAADALLEIVRRDRAWNDGAARAQLLTIFEAVGLEDPWVSAQRRKLSQILFS
jgi:putative thioredoxin